MLRPRSGLGVESGPGVEEEKTIAVYLSREEVASLSSMTASNAIRTLSNFAAEGIIRIKGRKITILDMDSLKQISELG